MSAPEAAWRTDLVRLAAVLSAGAGVVHLVVSRDHFGDEPLYGALFVAAGVAQLVWAVAAWRRDDRAPVLRAGLALQVTLLAAWAVSRVAGLPSGETPWQPEAIGPLDAQVAADELVAALLLVVALRGRRGRRLVVDGLEAVALVAIAGTWLMLAVGAEHGH